MGNKISLEKEITVEVDGTLSNLKKILKKNGFVLKQEYDVKDVYVIDKNVDLGDNLDSIFSDYIVIRNIITDEKDLKCITYKHKECDEKGRLIKNGKFNCNIENVQDGVNLFLNLGYKKLFSIDDHIMVYANNDDEIAVQCVNDKHIYIEIESDCFFIDKHYKDVEEEIMVINKYDFPIKSDDYFVKKAHIEFIECYRNKG